MSSNAKATGNSAPVKAKLSGDGSDAVDMATEADLNMAVVIGVLSSDPIERTLPSGDVVVGYEVTSRNTASGTQSVPVAWFAPPKRRQVLRAGESVVVIGHVRRRFFRAGGATASRTEVVASRVVRNKEKSRGEAAMALREAADEVS